MRSCVRPTAVLALLTLLMASPAASQFKPKLPKLPVGGKAEATASSATREPTFNDRVLEITDARLSGLRPATRPSWLRSTPPTGSTPGSGPPTRRRTGVTRPG
jgi:hypothetical protein